MYRRIAAHTALLCFATACIALLSLALPVWAQTMLDVKAKRQRTSAAYHHAADEYPWALAVGAIGFGVLASMLVPATQKERSALESVKRRAQEGLKPLGEQVSEKLESKGEREQPMRESIPSSRSETTGGTFVMGESEGEAGPVH